MPIKLITSYLLLLTFPFGAFALTDAWTVDVRQHGAVQRTYKQGETHDLTVTLRDGLKPLDLTGATAHFYWYTNATDNLWWTNAAAVSPSGLVTASWTPAMDTGAASYNWWIGIWQAGATSPLWRVTGTIRMLPSPGFEPNALPLPVPVLDFSGISVLNPPWPSAADLQAVSNALAASVQPLGPRLDAVEAWPTNDWRAAYSWGDHALAGYLLPAALAPYATTQQVAAAAAAKLDAASPAAGLRAEWVATVPGYEDVGHLKIYDPLNYHENALFLGPLGFGQFTHEDPNYPAGIDRFVLWSDLSTLPDIALATNAIVQHVAEAIAAIPEPDLSSRVAVQSGHASNLAVSGWLALPQSQPTNLIMRLVCSNDVIMAIGVIQ